MYVLGPSLNRCRRGRRAGKDHSPDHEGGCVRGPGSAGRADVAPFAVGNILLSLP